ncbi:alpha/beta hydrolase, partial [Mycobacterium tuberculosis]|nr:alpha/beta hydrolase [Mycobacterium tuberculosis]
MTKFSSAALIVASLIATGPALAQSGPQGDRVEVNGMEMYYEVSGEGDPMIVLHGAHMNIDTMGEIIPMLAQTHTVYA